MEHRFLVEQAWGRKLDGTAEMVLYVNGDKRDNRLENLYVCKGHVEGHKIIKGSLPWPSAGNVHRAVPRQYTDKWGPSALRALDKITGGSEIGIYGYIKHKSDL